MIIRSVVEEGFVAPDSPTISCPMTDPNFPLAADTHDMCSGICSQIAQQVSTTHKYIELVLIQWSLTIYVVALGPRLKKN